MLKPAAHMMACIQQGEGRNVSSRQMKLVTSCS